MGIFRLQCVVHREAVSGISLVTEQFDAGTDTEAIKEAKNRFARLLGARSGSAIVRDEAGRVVWTSRRPYELDTPPDI